MTNKPLMTESNPEVSPAALLRFFLTLGNLKTTKRTGWIENEIAMPESISDHMHRMSMMALMVSDSTIDIARCVLICLVHDVAEAIVGDIAPSARMAKADKQRQEEDLSISLETASSLNSCMTFGWNTKVRSQRKLCSPKTWTSTR
ncbi:hypothetical protein DSO57_1014918 [Entomophthora muscae]|uniref:Uncharacterized protein n=1 Tax=Entomophthora muscae TaxID=34485 RepID=A0ACC2T5P3_9FUNG|nr:hypothetical protein DSO57_1014918 [Entomophthora muscae]